MGVAFNGVPTSYFFLWAKKVRKICCFFLAYIALPQVSIKGTCCLLTPNSSCSTNTQYKEAHQQNRHFNHQVLVTIIIVTNQGDVYCRGEKICVSCSAVTARHFQKKKLLSKRHGTLLLSICSVLYTNVILPLATL